MFVGTSVIARELEISASTVYDVLRRYDGQIETVKRGHLIFVDKEQFIEVYRDPNRGKTRCPGCKRVIKNSMYSRHEAACTRRKQPRCRFCEILVFPKDHFRGDNAWRNQEQENIDGCCPDCYSRKDQFENLPEFAYQNA